MVTVKGPKFRSAKIYPNRKLSFKSNRKLPFRKKGIVFRKGGIKVRMQGVSFGDAGVSNIDLDRDERPIKLNNMGIKYYNKAKYKTALEYFNKALAVAPQFEEAQKNRLYAIQMMREQHSKKLAEADAKALAKREALLQGRAYKSPPVSASATSTPSRSVEVHPLDYRATRFNAFHDYGRIPHREQSSEKKSKYQDELGWEYYSRR